jgi:uncharacterized protein (TIGR03086 family)
MTTHDAPHTDLLAALDRAIAGTDRLIAGIKVDQWSAPTPCTEWDVRTLVTHVTSSMFTFAALVRDEPQPDHGADHQADDPVAGYRSAAAALRAAFGAPGALDRIYSSPIGPAPGSVLVHLRITELLVHGWDLAHATGQPADLPADVAEGELTVWRAQFTDGLPAGLPFAPAQPVAAHAPAIDHLAAFLGRPV